MGGLKKASRMEGVTNAKAKKKAKVKAKEKAKDKEKEKGKDKELFRQHLERQSPELQSDAAVTPFVPNKPSSKQQQTPQPDARTNVEGKRCPLKPTHWYPMNHTTEAQSYWAEYDAPPTQQEPFPPFQSEPSPQHENMQHMQHTSTLLTHLAILKANHHDLCTAYRNFGLLFHSFPSCILFSRAIDQDIRGFARKNFLVSSWRPLPGIIQGLGTISYALQTAEDALTAGDGSAEAVTWAQCNLTLAEICMDDALAIIDMLRQAVEILCRLRQMLWMEEAPIWESEQQHARRMRLYQQWAHALPDVCWG